MMNNKPKIIKTINEELQPADLEEVIFVLKKGGLVAYPTETVYGLGVDGGNDAAIRVLSETKNRPTSSPFALQIGDPEQLITLAKEIPPFVEPLLKVFWPGPLTIILPAADGVSNLIKSNDSKVGLRFSSHPVARTIPQRLGRPLAATSANLSGCPAPVTAEEVLNGLGNKVDLIIDGGSVFFGRASTVLDLSTMPPRVLRQGVIEKESLEAVLGFPIKVPII